MLWTLFSLALAAPIPVELVQTEVGWQLLRDGEPYVIRGAGGTGSLEALAAAGGNSVRTWGADDLEQRLDAAHALGLTVTVGIWLGHQRHGFDYSDPEQVAAQLVQVEEAVLRYREHPALLLWGIGNEMEGFESGDDPLVWAAVEQAAARVKELDPLHPTMTVTAELGGGRIAAVEAAPSIDIHGVNAYGGAVSVPERYLAGGGTKPLVLTEYGPPGTWELPANDWDKPLEPTSTEKAEAYRGAYQALLDASDVALGGYAFTWGHKMEATPTWFGMLLPDGSPLGAVGALQALWTGEPAPAWPQVLPLQVDGPVEVDPGTTIEVHARATHPDGQPLEASWVLIPDDTPPSVGGDFRPTPPAVEGAIETSSTVAARVRMPRAPGSYRLMYTVRDPEGHAATANVPLRVTGEVRTSLPMAVYEDGFAGMPWAPSGWMGDHEHLTLNGDASDAHGGEHAIRLTYTGGGWVGVAWQHPANDWGDRAGGYDLTGASALSFWVRGGSGGERITVGVGLLEDDKPHPDSVRTEKKLRLKPRWQRVRIPLAGMDLTQVKTGFYLVLESPGWPVSVMLDEIRFEE